MANLTRPLRLPERAGQGGSHKKNTLIKFLKFGSWLYELYSQTQCDNKEEVALWDWLDMGIRYDNIIGKQRRCPMAKGKMKWIQVVYSVIVWLLVEITYWEVWSREGKSVVDLLISAWDQPTFVSGISNLTETYTTSRLSRSWNVNKLKFRDDVLKI